MPRHHQDSEAEATDVEEISPEQEWERLDAEARGVLNVSGETFQRRWLAGEYRDCDDPRVAQLAMLLPGAW